MTSSFESSRRGLFRGLAHKAQGKPMAVDAIRPPGALLAVEFIDRCSRCNDCATACPEQIIVRGDGGFPELNFNSAGCTGCLECVAACQDQALLASLAQQPIGQVTIADNCLAKNSVTCQSCKDACDRDAIQFPITRATPEPMLNVDACNGCGDCVSVCPVNSIVIKPLVTVQNGQSKERVNIR